MLYIRISELYYNTGKHKRFINIKYLLIMIKLFNKKKIQSILCKLI